MGNHPIDPTQITDENLKTVLGVIVTKQENLSAKFDERFDQVDHRLDKIEQRMDGLESYIQPIRWSICSFLPWLKRNKIVLGAVAIFLIAIDAVCRWIQWTFFPPVS